MRLEDFVKQTLLDITNGVEKARKDSTIAIAPSSIDGEKVVAVPQNIAFEIAVTLSKEGGSSIDILPFELKGKLSSENVNRISFQVPVYFTQYWVKKS